MLTVIDILKEIKSIKYLGDLQQEISEVMALDPENRKREAITWCSDKRLAELSRCNAGVIICSEKALEQIEENPLCNYIIVSNPRSAFAAVIRRFFADSNSSNIISKTSIIHSTAVLGKNIAIGNYVTIEEGCVIGDNSKIGHNTIIYRRTQIGKNVAIGCNNTIGGAGFGYEKSNTGLNELIPHIGIVVIQDDVEIGSNTCIDRAVVGSTVIGKNVKIDNLVHIAHGVEIGENSLIIAHAMIGGSVKIGRNVWVAPNAAVINKVEIEDNAIIGLGAIVIKTVSDSDVVAGNPAKSIKKNSAGK